VNTKENKQRIMLKVSSPELDLGKKVSTPQDLMMEELSLSINRGSRLYQQRQKRVQRFVLENPTGYRAVSHISVFVEEAGAASNEEPSRWWWSFALLRRRLRKSPKSPSTTRRYKGGVEGGGEKRGTAGWPVARLALPWSCYSGPLKEVPPEKFNRTAIPKGYQSPWGRFFCNADQVDVENHLPEPTKVNNLDLRNFNRTPTPFGGPLLIDAFPGFDVVVPLTDAMNDAMLLSERPSFNRAPQGWIQVMPESEDL
uniref:Myozenin 3 n=1 Tax=Pseudonaja textilis TaxID=8673 RepID=A0A670ZA24_PSETE